MSAGDSDRRQAPGRRALLAGAAASLSALAVTQAGALLTFIVVANALAAIPLGSYLIAPAKTDALLGRFRDWIRARRRRDFAALLAMAGCIAGSSVVRLGWARDGIF